MKKSSTAISRNELTDLQMQLQLLNSVLKKKLLVCKATLLKLNSVTYILLGIFKKLSKQLSVMTSHKGTKKVY